MFVDCIIKIDFIITVVDNNTAFACHHWTDGTLNVK